MRRRRQPARDESPDRDRSVQALQRGVSRREVLGFALGAGSGGLAAMVWRRDVDHPTTVTNLADATDTLDAGPIEPILATTSTGEPWYPPDPARRPGDSTGTRLASRTAGSSSAWPAR